MKYNYCDTSMLPIKKIFDISLFSFISDTVHNIKESNHILFYFVESGYLSIICNNKELFLQPNQCVLINSGNDHFFKTAEQETKVFMLAFELYPEEIHLTTLFNQKISLSEEQKQFLKIVILKSKSIYPQIIENVFNLNEKITTTYSLDERIIYLSFSNLLLTLEQQTKIMSHSPKNAAVKVHKNAIVDQILIYMEDHLSENYTVEDFASHFFISPSYIKKIFKEHTGYSLINFYKTLKMEKAKEYIQTGSQSFTDIGCALGYDSIHHFSNTFKKYTGLSPSKYKQSVETITKQIQSLEE